MSITDEQLVKLFNDVSKIEGSTWSSIVKFSDFDYKGFDGKETARQFFKVSKTAQLDTDTTNKNLGNLMAFAITRGNITANNLKKMSTEARTLYADLEKIYNLKQTARSSDSTVLTVSRIRAAFPYVACRMMNVMTVKDFAGVCDSEKLPKIMKTPSFAALIPSSFDLKMKNVVVYAILGFSIDQGCVINNPGKVKTDEDKKAIGLTQLGFIRAAERASWPTEAMRKSYMKTLSKEIVGSFSDILNVANKASKLVGDDVEFCNSADFSEALS